MSMAAIGITSLALTGISIGLSASGALNPTQPNLTSSSAKLSQAKAQLLPLLRQLEAAAAKGEDVTFSLPKGVKAADYGLVENGVTQQQMVFIPSGVEGSSSGAQSQSGFAGLLNTMQSGLPNQGRAGQWVPYNAADFEAGGKYADIRNPNIRTVKSKGDGTYTVSFKGYGTADTQGKLAEQNAANSLALSKKYDSEFIKSALEQQKLADPEGFAARGRMHELIGDQANNKPDQPVARMLDEQVGAQLKAGRGLDAFDQDALDRAVQESLYSRGDGGEGADFSQPLTTGFAGEARRSNGARKALAFMTSGATPEDVEYRREQQDIANLSAEISGQTPQSQFASLSGAQKGPTPQFNGAPLPTMSGGTVNQAASAATTAYGNALAQPNQWMAGISTLINGVGAAGKAGWKPLGG